MRSRLHQALATLGLLASATAQAADPAVPAGLAVYNRVCTACHQAAGAGMAGLAPPLAGTLDKLIASDDGRRFVASVMVHGLSGRITSRGQVFNLAMAAQAALPDAELADVANYLARDLNGASEPPFTVDDFARARTATVTHKELRELRERLLK